MWFRYMNRIASRGDLFIERRKRARVRYVRVLYRIVLSEYTFRTRVSPHPQQSPTTPRNHPRVRSSTATAPFPLRDCRKDQDKVISYFRLSLRFSNTRTFGNWRTVESISTTYLFAKLLGIYVIARYGSSEVSNEVSKKSVSCQWIYLLHDSPWIFLYLRN